MCLQGFSFRHTFLEVSPTEHLEGYICVKLNRCALLDPYNYLCFWMGNMTHKCGHLVEFKTMFFRLFCLCKRWSLPDGMISNLFSHVHCLAWGVSWHPLRGNCRGLGGSRDAKKALLWMWKSLKICWQGWLDESTIMCNIDSDLLCKNICPSQRYNFQNGLTIFPSSQGTLKNCRGIRWSQEIMCLQWWIHRWRVTMPAVAVWEKLYSGTSG